MINNHSSKIYDDSKIDFPRWNKNVNDSLIPDDTAFNVFRHEQWKDTQIEASISTEDVESNKQVIPFYCYVTLWSVLNAKDNQFKAVANLGSTAWSP